MFMVAQHKINKRIILSTLLGAMAAATLPAGAAEWSVEPSVSASTSFSDNVRFLDRATSADLINSNIILSVSPALQFGHETEVRNVKGKVRIAANRFNKDNELNSNDAFIDIAWRERGERSEFSFVSNSTYDSTLATLLQDVGNPTLRKQRQKISINPNYTYNLDANLALSMGYRFEDVGFKDAQKTSLVDYRSNELLPSLRYKLDERTEIELNTKLWQLITLPDNLQIPRSTFKTRLLGGGYNKKIDESSSWSAGAGIYNIGEDTTSIAVNTPGIQTTHSGVTAALKYQRSTEYGNVNTILAREINPSGENTLLLTNRLGVDFSQGLTPYLTGLASVGYYKNKVIGGNIDKNVQYFRLSPSLSWKPAREWQIDGGVVYQRANSATKGFPETKANAKSAFLNFVYLWNKAAISR
jgi:opacity protein-like surface antigen